MPQTNFVIVGIVCRRNLDSTSSELHVDNDRIGNDGNPSIKERVDYEFSVQMLSKISDIHIQNAGARDTNCVPGVVRMYSYGGIA